MNTKMEDKTLEEIENEKRFIAYWGDGYEEDVSIVDESQFTEANGYDIGNRKAVEDLDVLETHEMDDMWFHIVTRVN